MIRLWSGREIVYKKCSSIAYEINSKSLATILDDIEQLIGLNEKSIDLIRDAANLIKEHDKKMSLDLFYLAKKYRANGTLINKRIKELEGDCF